MPARWPVLHPPACAADHPFILLPPHPTVPSPQDRARLFALVDATRAGVSQAQIGRGVARGDNAARWASISAAIPGSTPRGCRSAFLAAQGDSVGRTVWRAGEERALFQMQVRRRRWERRRRC